MDMMPSEARRKSGNMFGRSISTFTRKSSRVCTPAYKYVKDSKLHDHQYAENEASDELSSLGNFPEHGQVHAIQWFGL